MIVNALLCDQEDNPFVEAFCGPSPGHDTCRYVLRWAERRG